MQNRSFNEKNLLTGLNKTPLSWITIRHSLQTTFFITLGRIFDIDRDAFSADVLLKTCIKELDIFSYDNLRKRKIEGQQGTEPEWLDKFMASTNQPTEKDFLRLKDELSRKRKVFQKVYQPIRHKVIAHTDMKYMEREDELLDKTNIGELEEILWFLNDLKQLLFDIYENGREAKLVGHEPSVKFYENDFGRLLDHVSAQQTL